MRKIRLLMGTFYRRLKGGPGRDELLGCSIYRGRSDLEGLGFAMYGMELAVENQWSLYYIGNLVEARYWDIRVYYRDDGDFDLVCRVFDDFAGYGSFMNDLEACQRYVAMMVSIRNGGSGI